LASEPTQKVDVCEQADHSPFLIFCVESFGLTGEYSTPMRTWFGPNDYDRLVDGPEQWETWRLACEVLARPERGRHDNAVSVCATPARA
jgi:hypothetical protein